MTDHQWVQSPLGHGDLMCSRCKTTSAEAAVLGMLHECDAAPEVDPIQQAHTQAIDDCIKVVDAHLSDFAEAEVHNAGYYTAHSIKARLEALKDTAK